MMKSIVAAAGLLVLATQFWLVGSTAQAQIAPSASQIANYGGLHLAAHTGDIQLLRRLIANGGDLEARDSSGRTPLHVAAYASNDEAVTVLAEAGANLNALEGQAYDIVTIAAVADDLDMLDLALDLGADAGNTTSPYDGTALIAAAHLGHHAVVGRLIAGGAPLDHINNIGWTALIESVVLGDGGHDHVATARLLVEAGADATIGDRQGVTPYEHALARGYADMLAVLDQAR